MTEEQHTPASTARRTVYVLGSGLSLCGLTQAEKQFLAGQITVAMNKYLLFWDLIGVFPTHFFLADIHHPALRVYEESVDIVRRMDKPVHFLLADEFRRFYGGTALDRILNFPYRLNYYRKTRFWSSSAMMPEHATYFRRCQRWDAPEVWGKTLQDLMYFYRGSLSVLLNLITVLKLGDSVKLLGVDLNTSDCFYQDAIQKRPDLFDDYMKNSLGAAAQHMTAQTFQGMPGIQAKWPFIRENYQREGVALYCCNPKSLLVEEGLCPYAPVIDGAENTP
ncbi:MAG TPA: hypothetical protein PLI09_01650 [Candidatus Hydrogenedentes bacterium]|nr:hypothetical protein [Candidatus Hydrogenedentota bacterium]